MYFDLNDGCNLRCVMCKGRKPSGRQRVMDEDFFTRRAPALFRLAEDFQFGCTCEPLMVPYFERALSVLSKNLSPGIRGKSISNGTLLTDAKASAIIDSDVFRVVSFSMDASSEKLYEEIRRGAKHKKVLSNIGRLVNYRNSQRSQASLEFNFTIMRKNVHELPAVIELAADLGIDRVTTHKLFPDDYGFLDETYLKSIRESHIAAEAAARDKNVGFVGQQYEALVDPPEMQTPRECAFRTGPMDLRMDATGQLSPTCLLVSGPLGNIASAGPTEMLETMKARYLFRCFQSVPAGKCTKCYAYRSRPQDEREPRELSP
ncbi:MAG: radical SAM protein [Deltaproteobacteria bacterium]|nr:radical SAM protein [Deltaproteobacteria bacterium]